MKLILKIFLTALSVVILAEILPGVWIENYTTAIIVAVVLGLLNIFIRPLIVFLTLPATIVTFGLFMFVINACIILIAAYFINAFSVSGFWMALLFSVLLSFLQSFFFSLIEDKKRKKIY